MEKKSLTKNFIYNLLYQMLVILLPIITTPYVSRVLGAEKVGIYSYSYSVAHCFMLAGMLGVKNYGTRSIAAVRNDKKKVSEAFFNIYAIQMITTLCALIIYLMYIAFFERENNVISAIQTLYVLVAMADISWFFFGLEEFKLTVTRNTLIKIVNVILVFIFVKTKDDLWKYTLIMSGGMLVGYLAMFPFLRRYIFWVKPSFREMGKHLKPNLVLFIPVIAVGIFNTMDKVMLGWLSNKTQVGYYENAEKMMRIPFGVITAFGTVMLPRMSHMQASGNKNESKSIIEVSMCFTMFLACGMTFGLAGIADKFVPLFLGDEFVASASLLMVLAPTILFLSWANVVRTQYLIPNGRDHEYTISTIVGAIVNVIINTALIPKMGAMGAVVGTLFAEFSVSFYQTYVIRKELPITSYLKMSIGFFASGLIMFFVIYCLGGLIENNSFAVVVQFMVGFMLYCFLGFVWLGINRKSYPSRVILGYVKKILNYSRRLR